MKVDRQYLSLLQWLPNPLSVFQPRHARGLHNRVSILKFLRSSSATLVET